MGAKESLLARALRPLTLTKLMLVARRAPLTRTPADAGLPYEPVEFDAADGVRLKGWFIPRSAQPGEQGPAVVYVHGWLWNRLGNVAGQVPIDDRDVDFLPSVKALHEAGFHVLLFDIRGHGESEARGFQTYGPKEAADFCGAVAYLRQRPDVDGDRIGAIGTSMGGNIAIYGAPKCQPVRAILAVQPTRLMVFNTNFARTELGRLGPLAVRPLDLLYLARREPLPSKQNPALPARRLGETVVKYVQGTGDPWGTIEEVERFAAATPRTLPVVRYPSEGRYQGYRYIETETDDVVGFFREYV